MIRESAGNTDDENRTLARNCHTSGGSEAKEEANVQSGKSRGGGGWPIERMGSASEHGRLTRRKRGSRDATRGP